MKQLLDRFSVKTKPILEKWKLNLKKLRRMEYHRKYKKNLREWLVFHQKEIVFKQVKWMGIQILKNSLDIWVYQEIVY